MKKITTLLTLITLIIPLSSFASMAMPVFGINEDTKECAEFSMGDECVHCVLPDGWIQVEEYQCPDSYTQIEKLSVCTKSKSEFCCSASHSGSAGDCDDVVINNQTNQCAFVEDINQCSTLPENWEEAKNNDIFGEYCPLYYEWIDDITCEAGNITQNNTSNLNLTNKLLGRILLQVEENGEAWYVNPSDKIRYSMGRPTDAFNLMRNLGLGISNDDLNKIQIADANLNTGTDNDGDGLSEALENAIRTSDNNIDSDNDSYDDKTEIINGYTPLGTGKLSLDSSFSKNQAGKILLQVEQNGEAWYVNPLDNKRYFMGRPSDAFNLMRSLGLGITNEDISSISKNEVEISEEDIQTEDTNNTPDEIVEDEIQIEFNEEWDSYLSLIKNIEARNIELANQFSYEKFVIDDYIDEEFTEENFWELLDYLVAMITTDNPDYDDFSIIKKDENQTIIQSDIYQDDDLYSRSYIYFINSEENYLVAQMINTSYSEISWFNDTDQDGIPDIEENCEKAEEYSESCINSNPNSTDTDGDYWLDGIEKAAGTDINNPESFPVIQ